LSVRLLGRAFYADLPAHLKLTLLALCDEANDDGQGVAIGQRTLSLKIGATERTVRANLTKLREAGWIRRVGGKHALYGTDQYEIAVERLPETSSGRGRKHLPPTPEVQRSTERKSSVLSTGSPLPPTRKELPVEPTQDREAVLTEALLDPSSRAQYLLERLRERTDESWEQVTPGVLIKLGRTFGAAIVIEALAECWQGGAVPMRAVPYLESVCVRMSEAA
jgi:hypothetical protein